MSQLVFHHYPMSPFSEKIRAMLGYTNIEWLSSNTREVPPRPHLAPLVGGYRKIPVLQIGSNVFCDTRAISTEIAALSHKPELAMENCEQDVQTFVEEVDLHTFFACVLSASSRELRKKTRHSLSLLDTGRLLIDRFHMGRSASINITNPLSAKKIVNTHLTHLEARLQHDYLFGSQPNIADFSAYHSLWFIRDFAEKKTIAPFPKINAWMDRMKSFGNGAPAHISADYALRIANNTEPRPIDEAYQQHRAIGQLVSIAPADYAQTPTEGTLIGDTPTQWILSRQHERTGTVHVHFPKQGFHLDD